MKNAYYINMVVYIMFNCVTKKLIIGSTSSNIYIRFASHLKGKTDKISKKAAQYIINKGISNWLILPVDTADNIKTLKQKEGNWARII